MLIPIGDDQVKGGAFPFFSYAFIALNLVAFVFQLNLGDEQIQAFIQTYGAIPAESRNGQDLWSIITSMFLHGGWIHFLGNMLFLWIFADNIEAKVGNLRFFWFYLIGGVAAYLTHLYFNPESTIPTVGASGAISAVMGAYLIMFPRSRVKMLFLIFVFRIPAVLFLLFWAYQQTMSGMATLGPNTEGSGVAYWAHIGGFAFGVVAGIYFRTLPEYKASPVRAEGTAWR